jgi:uncharacterized phage protein gp47/JayE
VPFARPALSQLIEQGRAQAETDLPGADSRLRRSFLDVLIRVNAIMTTGNYGYIDYVARQAIPDTATGPELRRWTSLFGVPELPAAFAVGSVDVSGTNGVVIPTGTRLRRADATDYVTTAPATIAGGAATLAVVAVVEGEGSNADTGASLQFVSPILGVQVSAEVAPPGISGGTDSESEESLRQRLIERLHSPPAGGSASDYQRQAKLYPGVTDVYVYSGLRDDEAEPSFLGTTVDAEVNGAWIARGAVKRVRVVVHWRSTDLANGEVVSLALNLQDATDGAGAGAADFGSAVSAPALFTAPGAGAPHTAEAVSEHVFDLSTARAFLRSQQTLATSAAATATWSVTLQMEGDLGVVRVVPLFYDREDPIPTSPDLVAVAALLNDPAWKPITAEVDVYAPTAVPVPFTIVTLDDETVQAAIEAALRDLFRREATPGGVLLISHIREAISTAAGETDHSLTTPSANINLAGDVTQISTLGTITWM